MNRRSISPRDLRALVLLVVGLAAFFTWRPLSAGYAEMKESIEADRKALSTELTLLENATRYPELYQQADSNLRLVIPRLFLEQDNDLATVALQQYVDNVARSSSVLVTHSRNHPASRFRNGLRSLQIEIQAESDLEGILKFLDKLETGMRVVQVRGIDMRPGSSESGIEANENAIKLNASIVGFAIDTAIVRGHVQPPPPETKVRKAR